MVRVLATVLLASFLVVAGLGAVGTASAEVADDVDTCAACHCPMDVYNYIWNIPRYVEECRN